MPKNLFLELLKYAEICHFWVQNVKLGKIWPGSKTYLEPKFIHLTWKNKKSGQRSGYQKIWKILLLMLLTKIEKILRKGKKQKIKLLLQNKIWANCGITIRNFWLWFTKQQINKRALIFSCYTQGRIVEEKIPKSFQKNFSRWI